MKPIHYVAIVIILALVIGAFLLSPFSPLNKSSLNGKSIKLPTGYKIANSTEKSIVITNGSDKMVIHSHSERDVNEAVKQYKKDYGKKFNITTKDFTLKSGEGVTKTTAQKINETTAEKLNDTKVVYRNWFLKNGKVYDIQTFDTKPANEETMKTIISSM
ncbi:MAG: hypothetical protein BZ138_00375 [Methanosphaera sp. rholeuAM270]|nr:MAG: hypothetical protein BZ138_00375 [Methanosphaera sp. rholeuAM270]